MTTDAIYVAFALFVVVPTSGYILYSAAHGNDVAIFIVCLTLAFMHSDKVWQERKTSFLYGFIKGINGEEND